MNFIGHWIVNNDKITNKKDARKITHLKFILK